MEDFLVLGIVPNTNIQINFESWLILVQSLVLLYLLVRWGHKRFVMWYTRYLEHRVLSSLVKYHSL